MPTENRILKLLRLSTAVDASNGEFKLKNKFLFTNLSNFNCKWVIKAEGEEVLSGELGKIECAPLEECNIKIDFDSSKLPKDKEVILTVSFETTKESLGIEKDYEIAFEQFIINAMPQPKDDNADGNLDFDINGKRVTVKGDNLEVIVDDGKIVSYKIGLSSIRSMLGSVQHTIQEQIKQK